VSERVWQPRWSPEIEAAWATGIGSETDPRASIRMDARRTIPAAPSATRRQIRLSHGEEPRAELQVLEELGAGGMGRVFRARQSSLDREIAIKQLTPRESMPDAIQHFESEACVTAVLDHPNIVPIYDLGADQTGNVFYSMKLIAGTPWSQLMIDRARSTREHVEILLEVANAVAYAHSKGIIHRDIKPGNVMIGEYGEVTLVDWGLACSLHPLPHSLRILDLSQVAITCGTPAYMPPEISTGDRPWVGPWSDVYMLGAVLFEVLYGLAPHDAKTAIVAIEVAARNEWHIPDDIDPSKRPYHEILKPVVARALATQPEQRYPDGKAFADAMKQALMHLDSAELANQAIQAFKGVEAQQALVQQSRKQGTEAEPGLDREGRYRALSRVAAVLEQALTSWPENPAARHYLVEAHMLHAFIALDADHQWVAREHLRSLEHLPAHVLPSGEQQARLAKLHARLQRNVDARERKKRWMFAFQASAIGLALALFVGITIATFMFSSARDQARRERNHLSRQLIATASDGVEAQLGGLLQPVRSSLLVASDWAAAGRLDADDPQVLSALLIPLIDRSPVISSVIRADETGREYMLLRTDDGWQARWREPDGIAHFQKLAPDGQVLELRVEPLDYDPHKRPWYIGAKALADTGSVGAVHWTEPYTFFSTKQPGITASIAVDTPSGRRFVLGIDMLLSDLSEFTMAMSTSEEGKVFVLSDDFRVIGLPRSDRFASEQSRLDAVLNPLSALGEPVSAQALQHWEQNDRVEDEPFRFELDRAAWWSGFRRFELASDRVLWIGVVLPEADFEVDGT
jgi:serine/threonine protein kinase